jgi:type I restriction enzyme S subunit
MSWEKRTLGDLCQIEKGKIGIQKATPGEFPLVVTAEERLSHNEFHFEGNAVVIPLVSSTGHGHRSLKRIHFQSGKFAVGNILCAVIPNDENILRADYLYRFLDLNREKELVGRMRGMANVTLPMKEIAQIEIPVPPIDAQIEFVQQYSNLEGKNNELGGELSHQLDLVKQLRQSFLREAMQGKLVPQDPNDEPASVLLEKIKAEKEHLITEKKIKKQKPLPPIREEEIPFEIPENWVWCRLGKLYDIVRGSSPRPKGDPRYWSKSRTPFHWITIADFTPFGSNGGLSDTKGFLTEIGSTQSRIVKSGDLLIACSGVGSVGRSIETKINGFIYDGLLAIRSISDDTIKEMIRYFLKYKEDQIYSVASGANWLNINMDILSNYRFPLPPLSEQERIVAKLDELMAYCDDLEASIKESQQQNEMLLQQVLREALEPAYAKTSDGKPKVKEVEKV